MEDLDRLDRLLADDDRAVTVCILVGTAGVGKTSLAVHWAHRVAGQFADGQLYVNLHGYDPGPPVTPHQALERFLLTLQVPPELIPADLESRAAAYRSLLAGKRMLVLLDNAAGVAQVRPLLPGTAGCLVLITSRSRLSGLVVRDGAHRISLGVLTDAQSIELLQKATDGYRPLDDTAELQELAVLCARLPLALRIAAERAASRPHMPLHTLIDELRDESMLWDALTAGDDDDADAVRTVFAWSYRALQPDASRLFRLLGLHPGPEFSAAAAAALAGTPLARTRRLLDDLVGAHLLEQSASDRFQFHDLLRAYAGDQARIEEEPDEATAAIRRLVLWYLHTANAALSELLPQGRQISLPDPRHTIPLDFSSYSAADTWFDLERRNLVAVTRLAEQVGLLDLAWMLPALLRTIYARRNQFDDWVTTGEIALRSAMVLGDRRGEAEIRESLGKARVQSGALQEGILLHRAAFVIREALDDHPGQMSSLNAMGLAFLRGRRLDDASRSFERCHRIATDVSSDYWRAISLNNLANVRLEAASWAEAEQQLRRALELYRAIGDRICEGDCLHGLSRALRGQRRLAEARSAIEDALAIARADNYSVGEAFWLVESGRVEASAGNADRALSAYQRAATMQRRFGDRVREAVAFDATGEAYRDLERHEDAMSFHKLAVAGLRESEEPWLLATALINLGVTLARSGATTDARECLTEAKRRLAEFDDVEARRVQGEVESLLHAS